MDNNNPLREIQLLTEDKIEVKGVDTIVIQGTDSPEYAEHREKIEEIKRNGEFLNYDLPIAEEYKTFSSIDENDKYTERMVDCTGVVLFGKSKYSEKIISCIAHTDEITAHYERAANLTTITKKMRVKDDHKLELEKDMADLQINLGNTTADEEIEVHDDILDMDVWKNKKEFLESEIIRIQSEIDRVKEDDDLNYFLEIDNMIQKNFSDFSALVEPDTVTASIIGGQSLIEEDITDEEGVRIPVDDELRRTGLDSYTLGVKMWEDYVMGSFGFKPSVAHDPLIVRGVKHGTDVYVDTQGKKVFIVHRTAQR